MGGLRPDAGDERLQAVTRLHNNPVGLAGVARGIGGRSGGLNSEVRSCGDKRAELKLQGACNIPQCVNRRMLTAALDVGE